MKVERAEQPAFRGPITITLESHEEVMKFKALVAQVGVPNWAGIGEHRGKAEAIASELNNLLGNMGVSLTHNKS